MVRHLFVAAFPKAQKRHKTPPIPLQPTKRSTFGGVAYMYVYIYIIFVPLRNTQIAHAQKQVSLRPEWAYSPTKCTSTCSVAVEKRVQQRERPGGPKLLICSLMRHGNALSLASHSRHSPILISGALLLQSSLQQARPARCNVLSRTENCAHPLTPLTSMQCLGTELNAFHRPTTQSKIRVFCWKR